MTESRYIEPTPKLRVKFVVASLAVVAVGLAFKTWVTPRLAWVASLPACESLPWVRLELAVALLVSWYIAYLSLTQGLQTWRLGQTPLPNTWVWSRTRVRTGLHAKVVAVMAFTLSAAFFLGPPIVIVWQKFYLIFCIPQSCGCG